MGNMEQTTETMGAEAPANEPLSNVTASDTPAMLTAIANGEELQIVWEDYTLELRIQDWVDLLGEVSALCDECKITIEHDALKVRCVDPAHIAMLETWIHNEGDNFWKTDGTKEIGVDVDKMLGYFKGISKKGRQETFELTVSPEKRKAFFTLEGVQYQMSLIDTTGMSDPKVPTLNLPGMFEISDVKSFVKGIKKLAKVSDHIALELDSVTLTASTEGDMDKVRFEVPGVRGDQTGIKYRSLFPLEYLENILKSLPKNQAVVFMSTDYPVDIRCGMARFLLAPRIESGD
jgi:proliferating cell nuclear antigen